MLLPTFLPLGLSRVVTHRPYHWPFPLCVEVCSGTPAPPRLRDLNTAPDRGQLGMYRI